MTGIKLPTTEEQRRALAAIDWHPVQQESNPGLEVFAYRPFHVDGASIELTKMLPFINVHGNHEAIQRALSVLGVATEAPPEMVMVPREIATSAEGAMILAEIDLRKASKTHKRRGAMEDARQAAARADELAKHREQLHAILNPPASPEVKRGELGNDC